MTSTSRREAMTCSFCGKTQHDVVRLIAGPGVFICDECVDLCNQIIAEELKPEDVRQVISQRSGNADDPPSLRAWNGLSDEELLAEMVRAHAAHENVDRAVARHVAALRARGISWARIGEALGMTRQSAWERFSGED